VDANLPDDGHVVVRVEESAIGVTPGFLVAIAKIVVDKVPKIDEYLFVQTARPCRETADSGDHHKRHYLKTKKPGFCSEVTPYPTH
jgi:hypothetical protein